MTNAAPPRLIEGKHVLLAVLALALAGAGGGWWHHRRLQRRPLELWGRDAAQLLLRAPEVDLCDLRQTSGTPASNKIIIDGQSYVAEDCRSVAEARGFVHLRHSLLVDYSFDWTDSAAGARRWRSLLRFRDGEQTATVVLADDFRHVMLLDTGATACTSPIASGMRAVLGEGK